MTRSLFSLHLVEPERCEGGVCWLTSPEVKSCFVFIFPPFAIQQNILQHTLVFKTWVEIKAVLCLCSRLTTLQLCAMPELTLITYSFLLQTKMWVDIPTSSPFLFSLLSHCRRWLWLGRRALQSWTLTPRGSHLTMKKKRLFCLERSPSQSLGWWCFRHMFQFMGAWRGARAPFPVYTPLTWPREAKHLLCETQTSLSHLRWAALIR